MFKLKNLFLFLYTIASLVVVFSNVINNVIIELLFKNINLLLLFAFYLKNNQGKLNYWYISTFFLLIISDSALIFDMYYMHTMLTVLLINKISYIVMISDIIKKRFFKNIIKYTLLYFVFGSLIFYHVTKNNALINDTTFIQLTLFYILISFLGGISFVNLIERRNKEKSFNYFLGTLLISTSETIIAISFFIENSMVYIPFGFLMTYVGRYLLYKSMIEKR